MSSIKFILERIRGRRYLQMGRIEAALTYNCTYYLLSRIALAHKGYEAHCLSYRDMYYGCTGCIWYHKQTVYRSKANTRHYFNKIKNLFKRRGN